MYKPFPNSSPFVTIHIHIHPIHSFTVCSRGPAGWRVESCPSRPPLTLISDLARRAAWSVWCRRAEDGERGASSSILLAPGG